MAKKHLRLKPHDISDDVWWYEETEGMNIVVRFGDGRTQSQTIPWRAIRAALNRKDKK